MVMVGFVLLLVVIRGGRIGICVLPSKRVWEPKKVYDSRFRTVCVFFTQPCSRASSSARLCKKDTDFSAHNPLLCVKTAHICAHLGFRERASTSLRTRTTNLNYPTGGTARLRTDKVIVARGPIKKNPELVRCRILIRLVVVNDSTQANGSDWLDWTDRLQNVRHVLHTLVRAILQKM